MNVAPKWITIISGLQIFALTIYLVYLEEDKINSLPFIPKSILVLISWFVVCLFIFTTTLNLKWTIVISGLQIFALAIYLVYLEYGKIDVLPKSILVFISWSVGCLLFSGMMNMNLGLNWHQKIENEARRSKFTIREVKSKTNSKFTFLKNSKIEGGGNSCTKTPTLFYCPFNDLSIDETRLYLCIKNSLCSFSALLIALSMSTFYLSHILFIYTLMHYSVNEEEIRLPTILIIDLIVFGFSVIATLLAFAADFKFKNEIVQILTESF